MLHSAKYYGFAIGTLYLVCTVVPCLADHASTAASFLLFVYLIKLLAVVFRNLLPRALITPHNKAVLITGCDTGFGHKLAVRLDAEGFKVFAGCLHATGDGAKALRAASSDRLHVLQLDVTKSDDVTAAVETVQQELTIQELWAVVNNAGVIQYAEMEWHHEALFKTMFDINTFGTVQVAQAFLPLLRRSKGRVVNVTSLVARICLPCMVAYSMTKAAALSFCEGLRVEMMKWGVKVCSIEPWLFKTPLTNLEAGRKFINCVWEKTPENVKSAYGTNYLNAFQKHIDEFLNSGLSNTELVVDAMVDAVMAEDPLFYYTVAPFYYKVPLWVFLHLPQYIQDYVTYLAQPKATPDELEKKKKSL